MKPLQPWQLMLVILVGWINRQQQQVIEYLITENQVLKEKVKEESGKKRILLNDDQRRRLGVKGKILGRELLRQIATVVTPDTILRWHRRLVAMKWDYSHRRKKKPGRTPIPKKIVDLVIRFAKENPTWGYDRIVGALANLKHKISGTSVGNILREHGIEPAPELKRKTTWRTFLKAHWECLGGNRFHHNRSVDKGRSGHVLSAVRDGGGNSPCPLRRLHTESC